MMLILNNPFLGRIKIHPSAVLLNFQTPDRVRPKKKASCSTVEDPWGLSFPGVRGALRKRQHPPSNWRTDARTRSSNIHGVPRKFLEGFHVESLWDWMILRIQCPRIASATIVFYAWACLGYIELRAHRCPSWLARGARYIYIYSLNRDGEHKPSFVQSESHLHIWVVDWIRINCFCVILSGHKKKKNIYR